MTEAERELRALIASNPERIRQLWSEVGRSLLYVQYCDMAIAHYIAVPLGLTGGAAVSEIASLLEKAEGKTTGGLVCELQKKMKMPAEVESLLFEYRDERNWLAHRLIKENESDVNGTEERYNALIERTRNVGRLATHIQSEFGKLYIAWAKAHFGLTDEQIDAEALALAKRANER